MTSSSEARVLRADQASAAPTLRTPDLRVGNWTRFGSGAVLGDVATEDTLTAIAEQARATAEAQGFAIGWAKGVRDSQASEQLAALERRDRADRDRVLQQAEHETAVAALQAAAAELHEATTTLTRRLSEQAADLALAVTTEVLGTRAGEQTSQEVLRRALDVVPEDSARAVLRLSPVVAQHALSADLPDTVTIASDPTLAHAEALVELSDHVLDLRIDRAVSRVREALR